MTQIRTLLLGLALASSAACSAAADGPAQSFALETPTIDGIPAGGDQTYCTYLDFKLADDVDIVAFHGSQTQYGHHTILYGVRNPQAVGTHVCTEADMLNVRYLAAGGAEVGGQSVPDGIAFRAHASEQFMIQSHFINTTDHAISGHSKFVIDTSPPDSSRQPADLFTVVTTQLALAPHAQGTAHAECTVGDDTQLVMLGGHAHEWATHVRIGVVPSGGAASELYSEDWRPDSPTNPPIDRFTVASPLDFHAGDKITVDCDYMNTTADPLAFPREMCVGFGYYFPADKELDCVDGAWPR